MRVLLLTVWVMFWIAVFLTAIVWALRRAYRYESLGVKGSLLLVLMAPVRWAVRATRRRAERT